MFDSWKCFVALVFAVSCISVHPGMSRTLLVLS